MADPRDLHTGLCDLLDCRYPILQAGMGGVARAELAASVSEAGAYGFLGMEREAPALIAQEIDAVRARTGRLGGRLLGHRPEDFPREAIAEEQGRPIYRFSTDSPLRTTTGDLEALALFAGQAAGSIHSLAGAAERVHEMARGAREVLKRLGGRQGPHDAEPARRRGSAKRQRKAMKAAGLASAIAGDGR